MPPTHVVFDIGNVLVDWQPHLAWIDDLGTRDAVDAFMDRTDFLALNLRADGGARFADLASEIEDNEDSQRIAAYVGQFATTIPTAITGTWDLLDRLKTAGVGVHAITNWSAETWPEGLKMHPRLGTVFDTLVISGAEKMLKPNPDIFALFYARAGVSPQDCLFVDDKMENVQAARACGMDSVQFTTPEVFEVALQDRGLL